MKKLFSNILYFVLKWLQLFTFPIWGANNFVLNYKDKMVGL